MSIETFRIQGHDIKAFIPDTYIQSFWKRVEHGQWEQDAFRVFNKYIDDKTTCIDLGAYVGFTCCYLANIAKAVFAFEPDPEAYKNLEATVAANEYKNLEIYPYAAGGKESTVNIMSEYSGGNSGSSLLMMNPKTSWQVRMIDMNSFIDAHVGTGKLFIKIDIEGYEYELLQSLKNTILRHRPVLFIALHPQIIARMIGGNSLSSKIKRRFKLLYEHMSLMWLHKGSKKISFASDDSQSFVMFRILLSILFSGIIPEDRKELVVEF